MPELPLTFSRAEPADFEAVLQLIQDAARWIAARGSRQWSGFLNDETARRDIQRFFDEGSLFVARQDGQIVGTLRLMWSDRPYWGDAGDDGLAGYVHTLAVRRDRAGRSIGKQLLHWAQEQIRAAGRSELRVDCSAESPTLIAYYVSLGFEPLETVQAETAYRAQLFRRRIH